MRYKRVNVNNGKQVVLRFAREKGDPTLDDDIIKKTMIDEKLRPVTKTEFEDYCRKVLGKKNPKMPIVMFGNYSRGPSDRGSFAGIMYLDTDGDVKVIENWTRGSSGKDWGDGWEFLLASAA